MKLITVDSVPSYYEWIVEQDNDREDQNTSTLNEDDINVDGDLFEHHNQGSRRNQRSYSKAKDAT